MGISIGHILLVLIIVFVLFGAGKLPQVMSELARGLKAFKKGIDGADDGEPVVQPTMNAVKKKVSDSVDQVSQPIKEETVKVQRTIEKNIKPVKKVVKKAVATVKKDLSDSPKSEKVVKTVATKKDAAKGKKKAPIPNTERSKIATRPGAVKKPKH